MEAIRTARRLLAWTALGAVAVPLAVLGTAPATREPVPAPSVAPDAADRLVLTGSLVAREAQDFRVPRASSWQVELTWLIEEGASVEPGDEVARLDPGSTLDELLEARDNLRQRRRDAVERATQAELDRLARELELARAETEAAKARLDAAVPQDILAGKDWRERQLELRKKEAALEEARMAIRVGAAADRAATASDEAELRRLETTIARYERELDQLVLRADRPGIVVHGTHPWWGRKFQEGDQVQMGFVIARIPDLDTLEVHAWALEVDLPGIAPGQRARVVLDAYPERAFDATVTAIGIGGEERPLWGRAAWFPVTLRLEQSDPRIMRPGMSVRCELDRPASAQEAPR
ncbi:MAG: hypothetical protein Kow0062_19000 [Acidobacteriota bacterium]